MVLSAFMARRHGKELAEFAWLRRLVGIVIACVLSAFSAGCLSDQRLQGGSPRDLLPDIAVQGDRLAVSDKANLSLLLPLSGPNADIGRQLWDAAVMALFDSGRDDVILMPQDTKGTAIDAAAIANAAIARGTSAFIGPLFSSSVIAVRPVLAAHGLRGIALSNNGAVAGAPYFLIGNLPELQVDALASHLTASGRRRVLLFGPDTPYLHLLRERLVLLDTIGKLKLVETRLYRNSASYTDIAKEVRGITLYDQRMAALNEFTEIFTQTWQAHDDPEDALNSALMQLSKRIEFARLHLASFSAKDRTDRKRWTVSESEYSDALSELLQRYHKHLDVADTPREAMRLAVAEFSIRETLGKVDFDAVILPIGERPLLVIAPMFEYFNASPPDVWLVGTDVWESIARHAPTDLLGSRYVTATSRDWGAFQSRFEANFGYRPSPLASTVYDAVRVAATEKQETGRLSLAEPFLTREAGFQGVNGLFRFLPDGTNRRTLEIVELHKDGKTTMTSWQPDSPQAEPPTPETAEPGTTPPIEPSKEPAPALPPISALDQRKAGNG